ncbi:MAG: hypothetical protein RLZZ393_1927 [Pseudomonadota bacterium]|jgi:hypothetical protein
MEPLRRAAKDLPLKPTHGLVVAVLAALGLYIVFGPPQGERDPPPAIRTDCDRSCLERHLDGVMQAMTAHDPSHLPVTPGFRYVENNQLLRPGDGRWRTLQGFGGYRHYFADPESGAAAVIATLREDDAEGLFTLRIQVVGGRLTEAEVVVTPDPEGAARYERLGKPEAAWFETVLPQDRLTREELLEVANKYYGALENNDGKGDYSFFADECERMEHGRAATHSQARNYGHSSDRSFVTMGCRAQFETGFLGFITRIRDRRYEVIDVERGTVFAMASLDHNDKYHGIPLTDGGEFSLPPYFSVPRTLQVAEGFRIRDGKIHAVEMTLHEFPYGMPIGLRSTFDPSREVPGGRAPDRSRRCDAGCLESLAEQLLRALAAHDPLRVPLSDGALYTENDQRIEFYDGLWGTITDIGTYRLRVVEPARHEISLLVRVSEREIPGLLALRLRSDGDRIASIDASIVREERSGAESMFRTRDIVDPQPGLLQQAERLFDETVTPSRRADVEELASLVARYFDAVQQGQGGPVRFTRDCQRRENGVPVTNNPATGFAPHALGCAAQVEGGYSAYVARIRDRRILTLDEEKGLVVTSAYYDIPGTMRSVRTRPGTTLPLPNGMGVPHSLATLQVFRIEDGAIRRIEALSRPVPYGARPYAD